MRLKEIQDSLEVVQSPAESSKVAGRFRWSFLNLSEVFQLSTFSCFSLVISTVP